MRVVGKQTNSRMCYVCGLDNPEGLQAHFYNMEDGSVMTKFSYRDTQQSFPGRVHGGLVATMLDELGLRALWVKNSEDNFGVTMTMNVKLRKPVPYNKPLIGKGLVTKENSKFFIIKTEIFNMDGVLLAESELTYLKLDTSKIVGDDIDPHEEMCYLIEDDVTEINFGRSTNE